ncbi:hypothetical protein Avbf_06604 [Armadillidium vulgare]|nr:hypothetical protein Avbf_06604 [Armadillidium vulgare]
MSELISYTKFTLKESKSFPNCLFDNSTLKRLQQIIGGKFLEKLNFVSLKKLDFVIKIIDIMEFSVQVSNKKSDQSYQLLKKSQDFGSVAKKKKERENRNSLSVKDISYEWRQENDKILITLYTEPTQNDNQSVKVTPEEEHILFSFPDGRKFKINLFERIMPNLTKHNPALHWPSLEKPTSLISPNKSVSNSSKFSFEDDLNKENPLGMGGRLALSFAALMKYKS